MRRRLLLVGSVALGVLALLTMPAAPGQSASVLATGWWWRVQTTISPALPPPPAPVVPEGGLVVEGEPSGANAVSAIRIDIAPDEIADELALKVANGVNLDAAVIWACPAAKPWAPATAGAWEKRPEAACSEGSAAGTVSSDGTAVTFPLGSLQSEPGGVIDIVIFPGSVAGLPPQAGTSPFRVTFERPTATAVSTTSTPSEEPTLAPEPAPAPPPAPVASPAYVSPPPTPTYVPPRPAAELHAPPVEQPPPPTPQVAAPANTSAPAPRDGALSKSERLLVAIAIATAAAGLLVVVRHEFTPVQVRTARP